MVTPRQAQKIWIWTIDTALTLLVDFISTQKCLIKRRQFEKLFNEHLGGSPIPKERIWRINYELKKRGYLDFDDVGDSVKLTDKAKIRLIDKYVSDSESDGKRRLVSFDIPEIKKRQRNGFRRCIKTMGFRQIQKSLWVCDKNIGELVECAAKEHEVEKYVAYFVVEASNIDNHIKNLLSKNKD